MLCQLSYRGICLPSYSLCFFLLMYSHIWGIYKRQRQQLLTVVFDSLTGNYLLSRAVSRQVSSTWKSLTSVFGMGTGGSSLLSSPDFSKVCTFKTKQCYWCVSLIFNFVTLTCFSSLSADSLSWLLFQKSLTFVCRFRVFRRKTL